MRRVDMELNKEITESILLFEWLKNCGENKAVIEMCNGKSIANREEIKKNFNSIKWENVCLEARNDLTGYLAKNHPEIYNGYWNILVKEVKINIIPKIIDTIAKQLKILDLHESIIDNIKMDIVNIIVVLSYAEYYKSPFYEKLLCIYKNGNLPCGWSGKYPKGKIQIY